MPRHARDQHGLVGLARACNEGGLRGGVRAQREIARAPRDHLARASTAASRMRGPLASSALCVYSLHIMDLQAAGHQLDDQLQQHRHRQQQTGVTEDCLSAATSAAATSSTFGKKVIMFLVLMRTT